MYNWSGCTLDLISSRIVVSLPANLSVWITTLIVSTPDGICSKLTLLFSNARRTFLPNPTSLFILSFSILITDIPFLPAIPVIICSQGSAVSDTIIVPLSCGQLVFFIFTGMPAALTGKIASSWSTVAPIYANSLSSLYVIVLIGAGLLTILGSQIRHPLTSVQFS